MKIEISKLIIAKRGDTIYHYFRRTYNINKWDLFYILQYDGSYSHHYILDRGKLIDDWSLCLDAIDTKLTEYNRQKKIKQILSE